MESDELIKSSVEDLVHTPSESDGISESECDLPVFDNSSSKKDEVLDDIISIPLGNGNDHFNVESSPIESVLNRDNVISSPKIDFCRIPLTHILHIIHGSRSRNIEREMISRERNKREACSFMLCDLDFEPLSLSLSSMPSCDLVPLTN
ncbi:hypothetical protein Tco_0108266, partial [Tanacetum coccineum]